MRAYASHANRLAPLQHHPVASSVRITGKGELWERWMEEPSEPVGSGVRMSGRGALVPLPQAL